LGKLFQLTQKAQKLTILPDRRLPYIMTISQKRKDVPENVLLRQQQYQERLQQRYGYCINYLVYERPISNSPYIFLQTKAPFEPITTHSACWKILYNAFLEAGILKKGRICGTRLTRHNVASRMLRKGIPLTIISATLGHLDPNSVNIYLTTDEAKLAECTLPLPVTGGGLS
jgi:integrase